MASTAVVVPSQKTTTTTLESMPKDVLQVILESMPIQDAVRTSVLTRNWRHNWKSISKLVFDESFFAYLVTKDPPLHAYHDSFILQFLHNAPAVVCFHLFLQFSTTCEFLLRDCLRILSSKGLKNLTLVASLALRDPQNSISLPSHIYSCVELTHLRIVGCSFSFPSDSRGFPNLISLELHPNKFETKSVGDLITSCPILESMKFSCTRWLDHLNIRSQSLKNLSVEGILKSICLDVPGLETLSVDSLITYEKDYPGVVHYLVKFLGKVPNLVKLHLGGAALESFAVRAVPIKMPTTPLTLLKKIVFNELYFDDDAWIRFALCIMRSAPALEELEISTYTRLTGKAVEPVSSSLGDDITLSCLKIVKFIDFRGSRPELEMTRTILASSPSLEKIFIKAPVGIGRNEGTKISTELMQFSRASPKAEITLLGIGMNT